MWSSCGKSSATNRHTWNLFPIHFGNLSTCRVLNTGIVTSQYVAPASSMWRLSWCRSRHTWRWESRIMSPPRTSSRNPSPNSVLSMDPLFSVVGLCPRMYLHGIARRRFPDARLKIHLRSNFERILWASLVIFQGKLWRSDSIDYRNSLTFRATKNRNSSFKTCHNSYRTFRHIQRWYLYWKMILISLSQRFPDDNRVNFQHGHTWGYSC